MLKVLVLNVMFILDVILVMDVVDNNRTQMYSVISLRSISSESFWRILSWRCSSMLYETASEFPECKIANEMLNLLTAFIG